jgi:glycosyltransferase involved in cell wall biosynthesis
VYNRPALVRRAIDSCLGQSFEDFEVIVVDDGSTDGTRDEVARITDSRVRLIALETNGGVSPARNFAADLARGEWIVCLDSDDELTLGGLRLAAAETAAAPDRIDGFRFMCRLDDGSVSPVPPLTGDTWDYPAYLKWAEGVSLRGRQETLPVVRQRTFRTVRYPAGRALESLYHLDFAAAFLTKTSAAVVRQYHSDAPDQLTRPNPARALATAADQAESLRALLARHGDALARWAPRLLAEYTRGFATQRFLVGDRFGALRTMSRLPRSQITSPGTWAVLTFGLMGPGPLAWMQALRARHRRTVTSTSDD